MEDQLISYKTAVRAKETGFDLPCLEMYTLDGKLYDGGDFIEPVNHNEFPDVVSAPTQSLLQRWIREKHNLQTWIEPCVSPKNRLKSVFIGLYDDYSGFQDVEKESDYKATWEEALEDLLFTVLNTLPDV